jgi:hypothetical protein
LPDEGWRPDPDTLHYVGNDTFGTGRRSISFDRTNGKPTRLGWTADTGTTS